MFYVFFVTTRTRFIDLDSLFHSSNIVTYTIVIYKIVSEVL